MAEDDYEYYWDTHLDAKLKKHEDLITFTYPGTLRFRISDYCLGWTLSPANITLTDDRTVESY